MLSCVTPFYYRYAYFEIVMAISGKPTDHHQTTPPATSDTTTDITVQLSSHSTVRGIYVGVLLLLAVAIVWSGIKTAEEVQQYHQDYKTLQDMKKQERTLKIEHQRLLIEQQTFSATPQIVSRAVAELGMYSPKLQDKMIIQPSAPLNIDINNSTADTNVAEVGQ